MHANITLRKSEEGENEEGNERAFEPIFNQLKPVSGKIPLSELIHFCVNTSITPVISI